MSKRDAAAWVWDAVDIDHAVGKNVKGDRKMKCTWCGDEMTGGPARIRAHFVFDKDALRNYAQCSTPCLAFHRPSSHFLVFLVSYFRRAGSKSNAALAFKKRCEEDAFERRAQKAKKAGVDFAASSCLIASLFKKEKESKATKGVAVNLQDMSMTALQAVTADDLTDQLTKAFVTCGIAPFCLRNSEMKKALMLIAEFGKVTQWRPPTERDVMTKRLAKLDKEVRCAMALFHLAGKQQ